MAATQTNRDTHGRGRKTVTAAEKAQAREVSLRRIGRLFAPYKWQLAVVTAIIAASAAAVEPSYMEALATSCPVS